MIHSRTVVAELPSVEAVVRGAVAADETARARELVARTLSELDRPVQHPRLRLTGHAGRGRPPLVVAQINVAVAERLVRSQVAASTARDAVDRAVAGLRQRLDLLCRRLAAEATLSVPARWPDEQLTFPAAPVGLVGHPGRPLSLIRTKAYPPAIHDVDAAAFTMFMRDYPFHLFVEDGVHAHSLIYRAGYTGYGVLRSVPAPPPRDVRLPITLRAAPVPRLTVPQAISLLAPEPARRFRFFTDPATGRGQVLYRRYDGHLGLLTTAW